MIIFEVKKRSRQAQVDVSKPIVLRVPLIVQTIKQAKCNMAEFTESLNSMTLDNA